MLQIKLFKGIEPDLPELERQINEWLASNRVNVVRVFGNIAPQTPRPGGDVSVITRGAHSPSDILIAIVYEKP
ncbi:MAG: hypothetical protein J7M29_11910 [Verrucomicrobia bacterium]|nr:hypothetical protein [Verrucomicrobiota bacterium]